MDNSHLFGTMQAFITVVECGSFSECARLLGTSQPSISRQISALEEQLGVRLLQRTTRRLSLTEAGKIYYEKSRQIQRDVLEASQSIRDMRDSPSGLLRISVPHTWADALISPYLDEFLQLYPDIKLDIECNNNLQDMVEDRLDLVIRVGKLQDSSYIAVPFGKIRFTLCATPDYIRRFGTPTIFNDIKQHNFIIYDDYDQLILKENNNEKIITVSGSVRSNSASIMLSSVMQNLGITLLPDTLIHEQLNNGTLVDIMPQANIHVKGLPVEQVFALYSNRKHLPSKVRAFLDFFRNRFNNYPTKHEIRPPDSTEPDKLMYQL